MMKFLRRINVCLVLCIFALVSAQLVSAQTTALDDETKAAATRFVLDVYNAILKEKPNYEVLENFDESVLFKNPYDIPAIIYNYEKPQPEDESGRRRRKGEFKIFLTVDGVEDQSFESNRGEFFYGFPALNVKISGYQERSGVRTKFDIMSFIDQFGKQLADFQQSRLPIKIFLRPLKDKFRVREDVVLDVILKNVGMANIFVKPLNSQSLYFEFNNAAWGTSLASEKRTSGEILLKAGEENILRIKGESFMYPKTVNIRCFYRVKVDGVYPEANIQLQIVK